MRGWIWAIMCLFVSAMANAQQSLQLISTQTTVRLNPHFQLLFEDQRPLTLDDVLQRRNEFRWLINTNPNYGFQEQGIWLYARLSNVTDTQDWVIDLTFPQLDKVDIYVLEEGRLLKHSALGKQRPSNHYRTPTMPVTLPYATPLEVFVRIESHSSSLIAPIDIQSASQHVKYTSLDNLLWGVFYGGLLILAIYNFVLYFANRELSLLAYVGYIFTVLIWQFSWGGHAHVLLPKGVIDWLSMHMDLIFVLIGLGSGVFTITFLDARHTAPKSFRVMQLCLGLLVVSGLLSLLGALPPLVQNGIVYVIGMIAITSYLVAGFESYFNHFHAARYFIFAWSILACVALIGLLSLVNVFPSNAFTTYCFQVGVFLEAGLFSLALMDKNRNQLERDIQNATNDLRNNMEFIEEQNARLDIARKDAIKASHVKSQFLANMSHEIRTPLNAILGFSKELENVSLPYDKQEHVRIINNAADNLLCIVNDVLDVSKIEAGKLQINNQPFSPNHLLEDMVGIMAKSAHQKKLEFVYDWQPLPEKLIGDVTRIKQILNNLLSNALKFTPDGQITLRVSGREQAHGLFTLQLKVEDSGIGISQQDRKKLFSAFSQVDDQLSRSYQGTGLGLVICQQLVRLMGGKITLSSEPGQGSCFDVTISTTLLNKKCQFCDHPDWKGTRVLVVDPNPLTGECSVNLLTHMGANVRLLSNLAECDGEQQYDVLIATMPQSHIEDRDTLATALTECSAAHRFVLYSGSNPLQQRPQLAEHVDATLSMPLTPLKLDTLLNSPTESAQSRIESQIQNLPAVNVLAVDDMEMNLRLLETWLKPSPINLTLAYSGEDAVKLCQQHPYDLILMDVQMPNIDGLQATQLIRQTKHNLGTPIIAVTAHAFKEEQSRLMSSGMDDYLPKPIDLSQLIELLARWCQQEEHQPLSLPSLDWALALKRANQHVDAARDLLQEFADQLPDAITEIETHWRERHYQPLQDAIHKLHGVCCYTGVPKLQSLCNEIEGMLKSQQYDGLTTRLPGLVLEAELVQSAIIRHLAQADQDAPDRGIA
ncbi:response regulator [Aestuariibacter halophilus]|uniref:histidine kinase n=1 Tax=Fluctibacter halophilus TaxID=226011 RepID=A0ABS8G9Z3_9ALTE|nr:hybrid sensor histidine kinase/response regulator [Aestuariibacter halophilus]MCC2617399.1 response regulator [Aestuariibacter halophilus]